MEKQNYFSPKMAKKTDSQLRAIVENPKAYAEEARLAALWELEKRDLAEESESAEVEAQIQAKVAAQQAEKQARRDNWKREAGVPSSLKNAAYLIHASLGLGLISMFIVAPISNVQIETDGGALFVGLFVIALVAFLAYMISLGRNWARYMYVVQFALGLPLSLPLLPLYFDASPAMGTIFVLQSLLQFGALGLLFTKASRDWYKAQP